MLVMLSQGDLQKTLAQIEVNAKEAANPNLFVSGWRSCVGWACAGGFIYATAGEVLLTWLSGINGWPPPPKVDTDTLTTVLYGMLGLGTLRTYEKVKGAEKDSL